MIPRYELQLAIIASAGLFAVLFWIAEVINR